MSFPQHPPPPHTPPRPLTSVGELTSGQNASGIGQWPSGKPFCAERGT